MAVKIKAIKSEMTALTEKARSIQKTIGHLQKELDAILQALEPLKSAYEKLEPASKPKNEKTTRIPTKKERACKQCGQEFKAETSAQRYCAKCSEAKK